MLISEEYRELNRELHKHGNYGVSGHKWAASAHALAIKCEAKTVLDYGCGQGLLGRAMRSMNRPDVRYDENGLPCVHPMMPYQVIEYDPAISGKETKPDSADIVVCGDVLEHVEPECLDEVLSDIAQTAKKAVLLVVATRPAKKTLADGRNAHLIVQPARWWLMEHLLWHWVPIEFRNTPGEFVFVGRTV